MNGSGAPGSNELLIHNNDQEDPGRIIPQENEEEDRK